MEINAMSRFHSSRELTQVSFAILSAHDVQSSTFAHWKRKSGEDGTIVWADQKHADRSASSLPNPDCVSLLSNFEAASGFLTEKMLFSGKDADKRFRSQARGASKTAFDVTFGFDRTSGRQRQIQFHVVLGHSEADSLLTVLCFAALDRISLDELIFIKQAKWYRTHPDQGWTLTLKDCGECESLREVIEKIVLQLDLDVSGTPKEWPIFDFIELRGIGPAQVVTSQFANEGSRLTPSEHLGLVIGDEGYRFISDHEDSRYSRVLTDEAMQFQGRDYFLYHFAATSCVGFLSSDAGEKKCDWANIYKENVGHICSLDAYQRLDPAVPCMADGVPLLVESCMVRDIGLRRISASLETAMESRAMGLPKRLKALGLTALLPVRRLLGPTKLENAVFQLERLDIYNDSNVLWIIGGPYTDHLFKYSAIRRRIDRTIGNVKSMESELGVAILAWLGLIVALVSLVVAFVALKQAP
jgi:hypothetical protein